MLRIKNVGMLKIKFFFHATNIGRWLNIVNENFQSYISNSNGPAQLERERGIRSLDLCALCILLMISRRVDLYF